MVNDTYDILIEAIEKTKNQHNWTNFQAIGESFELHRRGPNFLLGVCELHEICEAFVLQCSTNYRELVAESKKKELGAKTQ
jgi:hypothetical protein